MEPGAGECLARLEAGLAELRAFVAANPQPLRHVSKQFVNRDARPLQNFEAANRRAAALAAEVEELREGQRLRLTLVDPARDPVGTAVTRCLEEQVRQQRRVLAELRERVRALRPLPLRD